MKGEDLGAVKSCQSVEVHDRQGGEQGWLILQLLNAEIQPKGNHDGDVSTQANRFHLVERKRVRRVYLEVSCCQPTFKRKRRMSNTSNRSSQWISVIPKGFLRRSACQLILLGLREWNEYRYSCHL